MTVVTEPAQQRTATVNVLCCSGLDPTGGAGLQADIEAVSAQGAHALVVATALTVQDTFNVVQSQPVEADLLQQQIAVLRADCRIGAIKLGLLGSIEQLPVLAALLREADCPVVMDPILRAGGGRNLVTEPFALAMAEMLFPLCTVLTPNAAEARRWTGCESLPAAAEALLRLGVRHLLITGGDEPEPLVRNSWYHAGGVQHFEHERITGTFHGAGCTLAASLAARLALGESVEQALGNAQNYVAQCLRGARAVGAGRAIPYRLQGHAP